MPSGAKKRKAAKKKKEQHHTPFNSSSTNSRTDDPKGQEERDSDGDEVGSPASQDHHNQEHPFNYENEHSVNKPFEGLASDGQKSPKVEDDSIMKIDRQLNPEQDSECRDIKVMHVEPAKKSHDKKSKDSREEGTRDFETEKTVGEATIKSATETGLADDGAEPQLTTSEMIKTVMEEVEFENRRKLDAFGSELQQYENKVVPISNDSASGLLPDSNVDKVISSSDENAGKSTVASAIYEEKIKDSEISSAHNSGASNAVKAGDYETSEYIETQLLVPPAPQPIQRTSCLSCCGLFDFFTGSNR